MNKSILLFSMALFISAICFSSDDNAQTYENSITAGTTYVIVQHDVADFDKWKTGYDEDAQRRKKTGLQEILVLKGDPNANSVSVVFGISDLEKARAFFSDPQLAEKMGEAGVISAPQFTYFNVANSSLTNGNSYMIISHKVADFDKWKEGFDDHESERLKYHIKVTAVGTSVDDPTQIVAIFNTDQAVNFVDFMEKSDLKEAMQNSGVISEPVSYILRK